VKSFEEYCKLKEAEREFDDFDIGPQSDEHIPDDDGFTTYSRSPEHLKNPVKRWITKEEAEKLIGNPAMITMAKRGHLAPVQHQGRWWNVGEVQGDWYMVPDTSTAGL